MCIDCKVTIESRCEQNLHCAVVTLRRRLDAILPAASGLCQEHGEIWGRISNAHD